MAVKSKKGKASIKAAAARNRASKSSSSKSSSSSSKSSSKSKAEQIAEIAKKAADLQKAVDKKVAEQKAAAASTSSKTGTTSSSKTGGSSSSAPTVNYTFDSKKETAAQYNARIEKERQLVRDYNAKQPPAPVPEKTPEDKPGKTQGTYDDAAIRNSTQFKSLSDDQKEAVLAVFEAIATNDSEKAGKIAAAFKAAADISNPFFKQELRLAVDAIERGFVSIDQEEEYKRKQLQTNLADLEQDIATQKDYLGLEEQAALRGIERQYRQDLDTTRQNLAATGKTSSSERIRVEDIIEESTGELRESTGRRFGLERTDLERRGQRGNRDTQAELARLAEVTRASRIDFLRSGEAKVGSKNLPRLGMNVDRLGNIVGDIEQRQTADIIAGANNLLF